MPQCPQCGSEYDGGTHFCAPDDPPQSEREDRRATSFVYERGTVLGSYRLSHLLGEGAIGRVYLGEHRALGRKVAVKVLRSEFSQNQTVVKRFFGEARAVNQIAHQNIVEITDFVRDGERCYYIMELLQGETLEDRFSRLGAIPVQQLVAVGIQITEALQAVHDVGIVHRDLKPENVFLTLREDRDDFVKVLDFGVAKLAPADKHTHTTVAGTLVGTPDYMSPEQAIGGAVDHRADIYSLGALLYEMSTGRKVFEAASLRELLDLHLEGRAVPPCELADLPEEIPPRFESLVMQCLEKEPSRRPQTMREVGDELRAVGQETSDLVKVVVTEARKPRPVAIAIAALLLLSPMVAAVASLATPEPPVEIAVTKNVAIRIDSTPPGAEVVHTETGQTLGRTPLVAELPRSLEPQHLRLRLDGYENAEHIVTPDEPHRASIALQKR